jgi:hypothetical protein
MGTEMEDRMDWNRVEGNWKEMKGKVKEQWGKLSLSGTHRVNQKESILHSVRRIKFAQRHHRLE